MLEEGSDLSSTRRSICAFVDAPCVGNTLRDKCHFINYIATPEQKVVMLTAKTHSLIEDGRHWNVNEYFGKCVYEILKFESYLRYFQEKICSCYHQYTNAILIPRKIWWCHVVDFDLDALKRIVYAEIYDVVSKIQPGLRCGRKQSICIKKQFPNHLCRSL